MYLYTSIFSCLPDMCLALFVVSKLIILIEYTRRKITKLHIMKSSPPLFTFSFLNQNVPLAPALSHPQSPSITLSLCSSLNALEEVSRPYSSIGKFIILHYNFQVFMQQTGNKRITRVGTLIVATIYLQLTQNRYMFRSFTVLQCSHHHCVQPVASDVEVVGYL